MQTRRSVSMLAALLVAGAVLGGCTYSAEPAPDQPTSPNGFSTGGFPPPGPAPVPGVITPSPVPPPASADAPRPATGPTPTEGPQTSENPPRPTGAVQPAPGS